MQPYNPNKLVQLLKLATVAIIIFVLAFSVYEIVSSRRFHVVGTNPDISNVATVSPFLKIKFNKPLAGKNISVTSSYSIIKSYSVQDKTLVINLSVPMTAGYSYYVKINSISDAKGDKIVNKVFSFVPKTVVAQDLPADQQQALLQAQDRRSRTQSNVAFNGLDALTNYGVGSDQVANLEQYLFGFAPKAYTITVDAASIAPVPHNRNSASTSDTINFNIHIDSTPYQARIDYSNLGSDIRLYLYNPGNGTPAFDSNKLLVGNPGSN